MENLNFLKTYTIEQFKAMHNVNSIEVRRNPHTNKLFFSYGSETGAVSSKGVPVKKPMISAVQGDAGDFYLLHEQGEGGAPVVATF